MSYNKIASLSHFFVYFHLFYSHSIVKMEPIVLVHGGAGDIPDSRNTGKLLGCKIAAKSGYRTLTSGGSVLDAVEAAVKSMELDYNFNCGYGSVLTLSGTVEMEASIMNGADLKAGCCTLVRDIYHPISIARRVLEKTPHNFLGGQAAMDFAIAEGFTVEPQGTMVTEKAREALEDFIKNNSLSRSEVGTVGAVAIDALGNVAAATSTGGRTGKYQGRIGDTPLLGCGTYADNRFGAVSTTGMGEDIMKFVLAKDIISRIEFLKVDAQTATKDSLLEMTKRTQGTAGAITVDVKGNVGFYWTSQKMAWAYQKADKVYSGISSEINNICEDV